MTMAVGVTASDATVLRDPDGPNAESKSKPSPRQGDKRLNIPTAELAPLSDQQAEMQARRAPNALSRATGRSPKARRARAILTAIRRSSGRTPRCGLTQEQLRRSRAGEEIDLSEAQLTWRGKDAQDWSDLVVNAPPLYIQEKIHPKAIIDDLKRQAKARAKDDRRRTCSPISTGSTTRRRATEFYQHAKHWQNRMILGDCLQVMASLAEREALRGKVQCIYFDPPYGIKFNSNWQVSTLVARREGRQGGGRFTRAGAGEGVSRHLEGRHSFLSDLSAGSADCGARVAERERVDLRADRR